MEGLNLRLDVFRARAWGAARIFAISGHKQYVVMIQAADLFSQALSLVNLTSFKKLVKKDKEAMPLHFEITETAISKC